MEKYNDLSELLESDQRAMKFYNSLPISLQQRMYKQKVSTFKELYDCAKTARKSCGNKESILPAASANECTGLIPGGADMSYEEWSEYNNLEPFGTPDKSAGL